MNLLALSFDHALLDPQAGSYSESRARQLAYAQELKRRVPGSGIWIVVRSRAGQVAQPGHSVQPGPIDNGMGPNVAQPAPMVEGLALYATPASAAGFVTAAYQYGRRLCVQRKVDLITSQSPFTDGLAAYLLRKRCGARWLAQLHLSTLDNPYWLQENTGNRLRAWLGRQMLKRADAVRVVSQSAATWLQKHLHVPADRIFVIPVGTDLSASKTGASDDGVRPSAQGCGNTVLFVGRLSPEKGLATLLHAFAQVKAVNSAARLLIAGDGPLRADSEALVRSLQLHDRVHFLGWVPHGQLSELYSSADIVAVPSLHESYGRVIVEAMSYARPVVATATQGARELLQDGKTGRIVPVQEVPALSEAIGDLLRRPQLATEMGQAAAEHVRQTLDPRILCAAQVDMWLKVAAR
jgi:glycosyltransferase involved in cell wall biosynthesis